jgi:hypothetical protein
MTAGDEGVSPERIDPHRESNHSNNCTSISPHGASPCYNSLAPSTLWLKIPSMFNRIHSVRMEADLERWLQFISSAVQSAYVQLRIFDSRAGNQASERGTCAKAGIYAWMAGMIVLLYADWPIYRSSGGSEQNGGRTVISRRFSSPGNSFPTGFPLHLTETEQFKFTYNRLKIKIYYK